jgi:hypothetical protein
MVADAYRSAGCRSAYACIRPDKQEADQYYKALVDKMTSLVEETITKWDAAGIFR